LNNFIPKVPEKACLKFPAVVADREAIASNVAQSPISEEDVSSSGAPRPRSEENQLCGRSCEEVPYSYKVVPFLLSRVRSNGIVLQW
jgi:hypothetical protein